MIVSMTILNYSYLEIIDNHVNDDLGDEILGSLDDDAHVRFDQIADRRHLTLQLRVASTTKRIFGRKENKAMEEANGRGFKVGRETEGEERKGEKGRRGERRKEREEDSRWGGK